MLFTFLALACSLDVRTGQTSPDLQFLVMADWGGVGHWPYTTRAEHATARGMGKHAASTNASFVLGVGDNFYYDGVKSVKDSRFRKTFEDVFVDPALSIPFHFVAGNHDHNGNVSAQIAYSAVSSRWKYPSRRCQKDRVLWGLCDARRFQ